MKGTFFVLMIAAFLGYWMGRVPDDKKGTAPLSAGSQSVKQFPMTERKTFTIVVYAYNQGAWCQRALRSIFEQDYDYYRVIFIDDGSADDTQEKARDFIVQNQQDHRVILIRNEEHLGPIASLYRAIDSCLDREIAVPLDAKDWLAHPMVLDRLNQVYQNPDVWLSWGQSVQYPSYEIREELFSNASFYSAIFKQIRLPDLFKGGRFATEKENYLVPLFQLAEGRSCKLSEPILFSNLAAPSSQESTQLEIASYEPLADFPKPRVMNEKTDIVLFSFDRPLQLYACLESVQRYVAGYENLFVLYRASDERYAAGYKKVQEAYPQVHFIAQSKAPKKDFKANVLKLVFDLPSEFVLFGVDDIIVKDFVDLKMCMDLIEKTGAYGFYLRLGLHIHHCYMNNTPQSVPQSFPLLNGVYAWDIKTGESDWGFPNNLDLTLYRKDSLRDILPKIKFSTPNSLEFNWAKDYAPKNALGLYFEQSKMVNIPLNIVSRTGNPHMNYLTAEELLVKFNQGLKIDIEPLYKVENPSPHYDYIPEFILR